MKNIYQQFGPSPNHSVLSKDGEYIALSAGLDPEILQLFRASNIVYVKISASTSGIHQACDRAPTFRSVKSGMHAIVKNGKNLDKNELLVLGINKAFEELLRLFPYIDEISKSYQEKIVNGCKKLVWVMQQKYLTKSHIKSGFAISGQHREIDDDYIEESKPLNGLAYSTVDYEKILECSYRETLPDQVEKIVASLPDAVHEILSKGRLSDEFMDSKQIAKAEDHKSKDNVALIHGYAQILSHELIAGEFHNHLVDRFEATDPTEKLKQKQRKADEALVAKYEKKKKKRT